MVYISVTTYQKAFIFWPWLPWRIGIYVLTPGPRFPTSGWGCRSKPRASLKVLFSFLAYADITNHLLESNDIWTIGSIYSWPPLEGFRPLGRPQGSAWGRNLGHVKIFFLIILLFLYWIISFWTTCTVWGWLSLFRVAFALPLIT